MADERTSFGELLITVASESFSDKYVDLTSAVEPSLVPSKDSPNNVE